MKLVVLMVGHQNLGHSRCKVKVIQESKCRYLTFYREAAGGPRAEKLSCLYFWSFVFRKTYT